MLEPYQAMILLEEKGDSMNTFGKTITVILIFLIGYVFGVLGLEHLILRFIDGFRDFNVIEIIGFASSIVTLILFGTYILGRYLMIKRMEITLLETIEVSRDGEPKGFNVVEEFELGENTSESIYLTSTEPIRYIKFYSYDFQRNKNGGLLQQYGLLKNGQAIKINTYLTCGIPNYVIEYQRFDYVKGRLALGENGKNGSVAESLEIKHTFKSIVYFLVR